MHFIRLVARILVFTASTAAIVSAAAAAEQQARLTIDVRVKGGESASGGDGSDWRAPIQNYSGQADVEVTWTFERL
jgi:hypothetical protein